MAHRPLPDAASAASTAPVSRPAPSVAEADAAGGRTALLSVLGWLALLAGGLILSLGMASLVGARVRSAALVDVDRSPVGSVPSYSDAPRAALAFFARRDTVTVRVSRDMTVADFLALYHLETNASARAALRDQLGAVADADLLREGDEVTLTVTVGRETP